MKALCKEENQWLYSHQSLPGFYENICTVVVVSEGKLLSRQYAATKPACFISIGGNCRPN